jgi:hypothetical protein
MSWQPIRLPIDEVHVMPVGDVIEHELDEHCFCGPTFTPIDCEDGSINWVYTHHSADGREHSEPDHDRAECPLCSSRA